MMKPSRLHPGDTVGVVSPSSGAAAAAPHVLDKGLEELVRMGLAVKELPYTRADSATLYAHPELRAGDINAAFSDPEIAAIITSIGGDDSVRILPFLDVELILSNPKPIMGMSDATTILAYLASLGLVTLYGPSVMAGLSQLSALPTPFRDHLQRILFEDTSGYCYAPYSQWSEGYPDWIDPSNVGKVDPPQPNTRGWKWLQGNDAARGPSWGGSIEVLEDLKGTLIIPAENCRPFRRKVASDSAGNLPPVPGESCHRFRFKPAGLAEVPEWVAGFAGIRG